MPDIATDDIAALNEGMLETIARLLTAMPTDSTFWKSEQYLDGNGRITRHRSKHIGFWGANMVAPNGEALARVELIVTRFDDTTVGETVGLLRRPIRS